MRTKYPLLIIVAAIVLAPGIFPVPGFSQAVFYQGKTLRLSTTIRAALSACGLKPL